MTPLQEQAVLLDDFTVPDLLATQLVQDILIGVAFLNTTENWLDNLDGLNGMVPPRSFGFNEPE